MKLIQLIEEIYRCMRSQDFFDKYEGWNMIEEGYLPYTRWQLKIIKIRRVVEFIDQEFTLEKLK